MGFLSGQGQVRMGCFRGFWRTRHGTDFGSLQNRRIIPVRSYSGRLLDTR